jgi:hypothetical protein
MRQSNKRDGKLDKNTCLPAGRLTDEEVNKIMERGWEVR